MPMHVYANIHICKCMHKGPFTQATYAAIFLLLMHAIKWIDLRIYKNAGKRFRVYRAKVTESLSKVKRAACDLKFHPFQATTVFLWVVFFHFKERRTQD